MTGTRDRIADSARRGAPRAVGRGFTLIEILVVIAVIIILVAAVIAIGSGVKTSANQKATAATLRVLQDAADEYRLETNDKDPGANTYMTEFKVLPKVWKIVTRLDARAMGSGGQASDAWGNAILFVPAGTGGAPPLKGYFYSNGPDGQAGTSDDIRSTEAAQ